jgi:mono/diheme cytochrome c family protein
MALTAALPAVLLRRALRVCSDMLRMRGTGPHLGKIPEQFVAIQDGAHWSCSSGDGSATLRAHRLIPAQVLLLWILCVATPALIAGCHRSPLTPQQAEGKHLYDGRCAHCHEFNDLALKKAPPSLHGVFNSSTLPSGAPATDANVERTVLSGRNMMPSFAGRFTQPQMDALLAYLHAGVRSE